MARYTKSDWLIPAGLIALAFIPMVFGILRLLMLAGGPVLTPDNDRFIAAPIPVVLHVVSVTIYCIVGAFQFSPGVRRNHPRWHRLAGRILVPTGLVAALSGMWMALTYAIVPADNALLHTFRLLAGSGMAWCGGSVGQHRSMKGQARGLLQWGPVATSGRGPANVALRASIRFGTSRSADLRSEVTFSRTNKFDRSGYRHRRIEDADAKKARAIRAALAAKTGVRRIARELRVGVGTVLRIRDAALGAARPA